MKTTYVWRNGEMVEKPKPVEQLRFDPLPFHQMAADFQEYQSWASAIVGHFPLGEMDLRAGGINVFQPNGKRGWR